MSSSYVSRLGTAPEEAVKSPCRVASTEVITLSGLPIVDTVQLVAGDRVFYQHGGSDIGIYDVSSTAWSRSKDWDKADDVISGMKVLVSDPAPTEYRIIYFGDYTIDTTEVAVDEITNIGVVGGDMYKAVYDTNNNGVVDSAENAAKVNNLTVETSVPVGAIFTDSGFSYADKAAAVAGGELTVGDRVPINSADASGYVWEYVASSAYSDTGTVYAGPFISIGSGTAGLERKDIIKISSTWYGSAGDSGTTDNYAPILAAMTAGMTHKKTVIIPDADGAYVTKSQIALILTSGSLILELGDNVVIKGHPLVLGKPVMRVTTATTFSHAFTLRGGEIDNSQVAYVSAAQSGTGLELVNVYSAYIIGTKFKALDDYDASQTAVVGDSGITTVGCYNFHAIGCHFIGQPDVGLYISGDGTNGSSLADGGQCIVSNCHFEKCHVGVAIKRGLSSTTVSTNTFYRCNTGAFTAEAGTDLFAGSNIAFTGNTFKFTAERCIELRTIGGNTVTGNIFEDWGYDLSDVQTALATAIRLFASNNTITGNTFQMREWSSVNSLHAGVTLSNQTFDSILYSPTNNIILGNTFKDMYWGIRESAGVGANQYAHNTFDNVTVEHAITNAGSLYRKGNAFAMVNSTGYTLNTSGSFVNRSLTLLESDNSPVTLSGSTFTAVRDCLLSVTIGKELSGGSGYSTNTKNAYSLAHIDTFGAVSADVTRGSRVRAQITVTGFDGGAIMTPADAGSSTSIVRMTTGQEFRVQTADYLTSWSGTPTTITDAVSRISVAIAEL